MGKLRRMCIFWRDRRKTVLTLESARKTRPTKLSGFYDIAQNARAFRHITAATQLLSYVMNVPFE